VNQRVLGFVLLSLGIIGSIAVFSGMDYATSARMGQLGLGHALSQGVTFGGLPLGLTLMAPVALGLVGLGFVLFGKK